MNIVDFVKNKMALLVQKRKEVESFNKAKNKLYKDPTEWTEWTECSKWCEKGIQARQRLKASADITRGNRADIERKG